MQIENNNISPIEINNNNNINNDNKDNNNNIFLYNQRNNNQINLDSINGIESEHNINSTRVLSSKSENDH